MKDTQVSNDMHFTIAKAMVHMLIRYRPEIHWMDGSDDECAFRLTAYKRDHTCTLLIYVNQVLLLDHEPNESGPYKRRARTILLADPNLQMKVDRWLRDDFRLQHKFWTQRKKLAQRRAAGQNLKRGVM